MNRMKKYMLQCRDIIIYIEMDSIPEIGDKFTAGAFDFTVIDDPYDSEALFCLEDDYKSAWYAWDYSGDNKCLTVARLKQPNVAHGYSEGADLYQVWDKENKDLKIVSADTVIEDLRAQLAAADKRCKELEQWKEEELLVWGPVLDYAQENGDKLGIKLGQSCSTRILEILKNYAEL